jgi:hypothetical protein
MILDTGIITLRDYFSFVVTRIFQAHLISFTRLAFFVLNWIIKVHWPMSQFVVLSVAMLNVSLLNK